MTKSCIWTLARERGSNHRWLGHSERFCVNITEGVNVHRMVEYEPENISHRLSRLCQE